MPLENSKSQKDEPSNCHTPNDRAHLFSGISEMSLYGRYNDYLYG